MGDMIIKDNLNGFTENCSEMGNTFGLFNKQTNSEDQSVEQTYTRIDELKSSNGNPRKFIVCHELDNKNKYCTARTQCIASKCEMGSDLSKSQLEKLKELQSNWVELHKCIRFIYKNAISSVPCIVVHEEIPKRVTDSIKELIEKLCEEDYPQLFIRLEVLVRDFVLEARDRLKDLQNNVDDIPVLYLRGLLASYSAFCVAADNLAPFLPQLDTLLKKRFSIDFQLLNKHLFQTCLYADSFVQNNVPLYISQLRTTNSGTHFTNQELVHSYLAFDDEMTDIASRWLDVKKMILKLSKKRVSSNCKQPLLLEDWKLYREHRELATSRTWQLRTVKKDLTEFDVQLLSLLDDITSHMCELEVNSSIKAVFTTCKNCNTDILCSCDDCTIKHILTCVETPPTSPLPNIQDNTYAFNQSQILQQFNAATKMFKNSSNELPDTSKSTTRIGAIGALGLEETTNKVPGTCQGSDEENSLFLCNNKMNKIPMPKNFLKLITDKVMTKSFVKGCDDDTQSDITATDCEATLPRANLSTTAMDTTTATPPSATSKVPANPNMASNISHSPLLAHNQHEINTSTPISDKQGGTAKEVSKVAPAPAPTNHNKVTCNHGNSSGAILPTTSSTGTATVMNKKPKEPVTTTSTGTQMCKDGCVEHGPVKTNKESKQRCDCPHCEVFESTNAQVSGKNNKTRDRLRIRLNEIRNKKALKEKNAVPKTSETNNNVEQNNTVKSKDSSDSSQVIESNNNPVASEDTRDIRDLINFIEGTDRNTKIINAQKKLAKKARRRERKLEEERLKEEERQRQEAERLLEEERKLKEKKRQEEAKLKEQQAAAKNKKNKNHQNANGKVKDVANNNRSTKGGNTNNNNKGASKTINLSTTSTNYIPPTMTEKPKTTPPQQQPQTPGPMVTIKRVMECSSSEPTVTITLKGSTPDKDKLLYTLINGQMTKKQKKKAKREQQKQAAASTPPAPLPSSIPIPIPSSVTSTSTTTVTTVTTTPPPQLSKKERKNKQKELAKGQNKKLQPTSNNQIENSITDENKSVGAQLQQNNNNNNKSKPELNLQMLRLPPGITITKVDGPAVNRKLKLNQTKNTSPVPPIQSPTVQSTDNRSGVIVVDTVKLKEVLPAVEQQQQPQQQPPATQSKKNKKKKKKNKSDNNQSNNNNNSNNSQQNNIFTYKISETPASTKSTNNSNSNCNSIVTIKNPMFYQLQESLHGKLNKPKMIENPKDIRPQQASIIKGANGMVTIRSPRLSSQTIQCNGHGEAMPVPMPIHSTPSNQLLSDLKPVIGPNTSVFKPMKREDNNKPFNAQEILSGLPGIEITKINKNTSRSKNDCKVFQPADVSIIPTNIANGTNGDVYKLFYDNMDWSLESVFAPKDIKEDEVLDEDELELEAFKRFCQQSVPPERKKKVAHLNVKDIVLKKKTASSNAC